MAHQPDSRGLVSQLSNDIVTDASLRRSRVDTASPHGKSIDALARWRPSLSQVSLGSARLEDLTSIPRVTPSGVPSLSDLGPLRYIILTTPHMNTVVATGADAATFSAQEM